MNIFVEIEIEVISNSNMAIHTRGSFILKAVFEYPTIRASL